MALAAWGPASSVSPPLAAALASALWPGAPGSRGWQQPSLSWAVPSSPQALISPPAPALPLWVRRQMNHPLTPSFRFLLKDRPLNLKGFFERESLLLLGGLLGGTSLSLSALARGCWLDGITSGPCCLSVPFTGRLPHLGGISLHIATWPFSCSEKTAVRVGALTPSPSPPRHRGPESCHRTPRASRSLTPAASSQSLSSCPAQDC